MIKSIIFYRTDDGSTFDTKEKAEKYEIILNKVNTFLSPLPYNSDTSFCNGEGYIQHTSDIYDKMEELIVKLSNEWFNLNEPFTHFNYILGRYVDDNNVKCLNNLVHRFMCIDKNTHREYGQPYFANNPQAATDKQLN